ncbi:hypothetical protein C4565_00650 [Candidatus Parcubacteria bacterium]|nr:MAG: hypothetical protein C4565_00650 [Candidatus Parcubacteria bacterium]
MANWKHNIELNKVINQASEEHDLTRFEEDCPEEVKEAIAREIEKAWPLSHHAKEIRAVKSIAALNRRLVLVFDDADYHKVWCGF